MYLAEYAALTNRCTSWLTLMVPIWAVLGALLAVIATFWNSFPDHVALMWTTGVGAQLVVLMWFQTIEEQYLAISYIQRKLRPPVAKITGASGFWTYESSSAGRNDPLSWWGEWLSPPIFAGLLIAVVIETKRWPFQSIDYWGFSLNVLLIVIQLLKTIFRVHLRRGIAAAEKEHEKRGGKN